MLICMLREKHLKVPEADWPTIEECEDWSAAEGRRLGLAYSFVKRFCDIFFSLLVLVIFLPIWIIVAIIVAIDTKASPLYVQKRVGKGEVPFNIIKFRTMVKDSDDVEKYLSGIDLETWKRERKVDHDPRITRIGRFLRRTSLDEVPNFLNVLAGSMSVVGPRPITQDELAAYNGNKSKLLSVRPGITGWWQVEARNDADFASGSRQEMELYYVDNASFKMDLRIFLKTFKAMGEGQ